jgi:hypothetical protein
MKLGFNYGSYGDVSFLLYVLTQGKIHTDFYDPSANKRFEIHHQGDVFLFSPNYEDIVDCDKKIKLVSNDNQLTSYKDYDKTIVTPVDSIRAGYTNEDIQRFLDQGNLFLSMSTISFEHKNFVFYPLFSLVYHYYQLGYKFLNFYQNSNKHNLLGIYHRPTHIGGTRYPRRNYIYDQVKDRLGDDFVCYPSPSTDLDLLLDSYRFFGQWYNTHISSYTDYSTSVANIIFETFDSHGTYSYDSRLLISEKTLKALLFSKENIFFIWYGHDTFIPHLKDHGFWFLNFEFYDAKNNSEDTAVFDSLIKTTEYLRQLKNQLGGNETVYKYLLEKYGKHLERNSMLFDQLIHQCSISDQVISLIKQ